MSTAHGHRHGYTVLRPAQFRDVNAVAILRYLLAHGPHSRAEIAAEVGLTQGPVTRITARLVERGLLQELPSEGAGGRGRPRVPLAIVPDAYQIIGVHIGLEHVTIGLTDTMGRSLVEERTNHDGSVDDVIRIVIDVTERLRLKATATVLGLGVIIGGWVDPSAGVVRHHELLDWHDVPLRSMLEAHSDLPIYLESNVRAHAASDVVHGTVREHDRFIHVFVGNLAEVAIVIGGRVQSGPHGFGGSISDWPLDDGSGTMRPAREILSDQFLVARGHEQGLIPADSVLEDLVSVAEGASSRADGARELLLNRARLAGQLIAQLNAVLAPELIVVSSGVLYLEGSLEALVSAFEASPLTSYRPVVQSGNLQRNTLITSASTAVLTNTLLNSDNLKAPPSETSVSDVGLPAASPLRGQER